MIKSVRPYLLTAITLLVFSFSSHATDTFQQGQHVQITDTNNANVCTTTPVGFKRGLDVNCIGGCSSGGGSIFDGGNIGIVTQGPSNDGGFNWHVDVGQWGGAATSLGQKTSANSVPTVLASDQSAIPVSQSGTWTVQQGTPPWSVNQTQVNGTTVSTGNGVAGAGVQRVTIASDNTAFSVNNTQVGTASQNVAQWGGVATSLGQKVSASSVPVVLASDQSAINVNVVFDGGIQSVSYPNVISAGNSSTTPLGGGATFTGTGVEVTGYAQVQVFIFSDKASAANGAQLQSSTDNVNWDDVQSYSVVANVAENVAIGPPARFFRVVYTNGGAAQGVFRLQTILRLVTGVSSVTNVDSVPVSGDLSLVTQSVIVGKTTGGGGGYVAVKVNPSGTLTVDASGSNVNASQSGTWTVQQGTPPWSMNVTQINGTTVSTGNGIAGAGTQRVTIASDNTAFSVNNTQVGTASQNVAQFGGTNVSTGTGASGAGIPRVTISNDSSLAANQSVNVSQFGGTNVSTGTGASGAGIPRVTVANDSSILGTKTNNAAAPGATNFGALPALANAANPTWTEGNLVLESVDLSGRQRQNLSAVAGTATVTGGLAGTLAVGGTQATNTAITANPMLIGLEAQSGQPTAATTGNIRQAVGSLDGVTYVRQGGPVPWTCSLDNIGATLTQCQAAPGAGLKLYLTSVIINSTTATAGLYLIRFGTGANCGTGTTSLLPSAATVPRFTYPQNAGQTSVSNLVLNVPISATANNAICIICTATNTCTVQMIGFTAP